MSGPVALILASIAPTVVGHGMLTRPAARNVLLNAGLTHPGAGQCDVTSPNKANMNGCQGGVGPFTFNKCWSICGGDYLSTSSECAQCKREVVDAALENPGFRRLNVQPEPRLGVCGDLADNLVMTDPALQGCSGQSCVEQALSRQLDTIVVDAADNSFEVSMTITAYHYGWVEFRLCPEGGRGADGHGVTQECFNQHVLRFDVADAAARYTGSMDSKGAQDPSDYVGTKPSSRCDGPGAELKLEAPEMWSPPGTCCFDGGDCGSSNSTRDQDVRFVLPASSAGPDYTLRLYLPDGLTCSQAAPCTLQWTYMTGNTEDGYPEVFRNCADFSLGQSGSATAAPTTQPATTAAPSTQPATTAVSTAQPATTVAPTTQPATTAAPTTQPASLPPAGGACVRETDCTRSLWCNDASYDAWCANHAVSECTAVQCRVSGEPAPAPEPTPEPEPEPTPEPSPTPSAGACPSTCSGCFATNNVCYDVDKSWCDERAGIGFAWCGALSLSDTGRVLRRSRKHAFLGAALLETASSLSRGASGEL